MNDPIPTLFFSRGRGHGHAIPDMAIADEIAQQAAHIKFTFASYATGADTFRKRDVPVCDMKLPEANRYLDTFFIAHEMIAKMKPRVVVAHEEFAAIAAARLAGVPSIFLSAWLPALNSIFAESLTFADAVIVIDDPGVFPVPPGVKPPVYTGPIVREMKYIGADRGRIRNDLDLREDEPLILVVPGGWATEARAPLVDLMLSAFFNLPQERKRMIFLAGRDFELVTLKTQGIKGVEVIAHADPIERLIVASDVVITKATRGITLEAAHLGVPSISVSYGQNPVDEALVPRIRSNTHLNVRAVNAEILGAYIKRIVDVPYSQREVVKLAPLPRNGLTATTALIDAIQKSAQQSTLLSEEGRHAVARQNARQVPVPASEAGPAAHEI